ncbi:MAG: hypothetical protein HY422_03075 [Candidatus Komeilibacteria bacterium]|nr:hypothetical protein [Candidatus Komeilibacteria bacterium]
MKKQDFSKLLAVATVLLFFLSVVTIDLQASEIGTKTLPFGTPHFSYSYMTNMPTAHVIVKPHVAGYTVGAAIFMNNPPEQRVSDLEGDSSNTTGTSDASPTSGFISKPTDCTDGSCTTTTTTPTSTPPILEKITICHRNSGTKEYSELSISRDGWEYGHKQHSGDFIKTETGDCKSTAVIPFSGGVVDEPRNVPGLVNEPQTLTTEQDALIRKLHERIRRLELKLSDLEKEVVARAKDKLEKIDEKLTDRVKGRILLQVENKGEAWYVDPATAKKFYLKDGASAYQALQVFGLGITNDDLNQIPVAADTAIDPVDTDADGVPDALEQQLGTDPAVVDSDQDGFKDGEEVLNNFNPLGNGAVRISQSLVNRLKGRIVLQTQSRGEAWYINPVNGKRYYLKDGVSAYQIMRRLSLGIKDQDLNTIDVGTLSPDDITTAQE